MTGKQTRDDITKLVGASVRASSEDRERLVIRILAAQERGVRLGYETSVWHEAAALFGYRCHCGNCADDA